MVSLTYEDYVVEVKRLFIQYFNGNVSEEDATKYFEKTETIELLQDDYKGYSKRNITKISPSSTASCLYMLY